MNKIIKSVIRWKVYYDRGRSYVSMIQSLIVVSMFVKLFEFPVYFYYLLIPFFIVSMLIIGFIDKKYKLREEEIKEITNQNVIMKQIQNDVKEIRRKIK